MVLGGIKKMNSEPRNTGYPESEAKIYDQKRFSDPPGRLFDKLETQQLVSVLNLLSGKKKILEVGCGTGRFMLTCLTRGHEVHGIDPSEPMLEQCKQKNSGFPDAHFHLGEGSRLPFADNVFDLVYSIRTMNQLSSKEYALEMVRELIRVCDKGGIILVEFVNSRTFRLIRHSAVAVSVDDIRGVVMDCGSGLSIVNITGILFFSQTLMNLMPLPLLGIFEEVDKLFCKAFPAFAKRCYVTIRK